MFSLIMLFVFSRFLCVFSFHKVSQLLEGRGCNTFIFLSFLLVVKVVKLSWFLRKQWGVVNVRSETWRLRFWLWLCHWLITWLCRTFNHCKPKLFLHESRGFNYMTSPIAQTVGNDVMNGMFKTLETKSFLKILFKARKICFCLLGAYWVILMQKYIKEI